MSVLKIKKNGVWENVSGASGHTHTINDITDFPEDFTTSGGDADTLDGKHASDFAAADHTHEQINVLTSLVGDTDVSTQIADAIVSKADSNHPHDEVTATTSGFMVPADKEKLDGIDEGANKTTVDSALSATSTNPVENKVLYSEIENLHTAISEIDVSGQIADAIVDKADTDHTHTDATDAISGFMSYNDKEKLDTIEEGANKTIVDLALDSISTNPVQNKVLYEEIENLHTAISDIDVSGQIADAISEKADVDHTHTLDSFGIIASVVELNKLDGITSNVQNQLDDKAESGHTHDEYAESGHTHDATDITGGTLDTYRLPTVPISKGGTGATTASDALEALGVVTYVDDAISNIATDITVDTALSSTSTNPVQNKVVNLALAGKASSSHTHGTDDITGLALHIRRGADTANTVGNYGAHAEGNTTKATGDASHAEGTLTTASGSDAHAEGKSTTASGKTSHAEGYNTKTSYTKTDGTTYSGEYAHAEGSGTSAGGSASHAEGYNTIATGHASHAGGNGSKAWGATSFVHGYQCTAFNDGIAMGNQVHANVGQTVFGKLSSASSTDEVKAGSSGDEKMFRIGGGYTAANSGDFDTLRDIFSLTVSGKCYLKGPLSQNATADFAEYFEWNDGNSENEDRRGRIVTLDGDKIRLATSEDAYVLGVVSCNAALIGNAANDEWHGMYLKDVFGKLLTEDVTFPEEVDEVTGTVTPSYTTKRPIINPDYDPSQEYIDRELRQEWSVIGMLGQIVVVDDGTCVVNGHCAPSVDGIGTAADSGYRVMKRIDDTHVKVLVK